MIGFQVTINNRVFINTASRSNHLFFFEKQGEITLLNTGIDDDERNLVHPSYLLRKGDVIKVKIMDLNSTLETRTSKSVDIHYIKKRYEYLKEELTKEGLI
jgi:hypothetical protein